MTPTGTLYNRAATDREKLADASVNDPRVQPWTRLFAETGDEPVRITPDVGAPAVLLTTSGTTGQPKFVIHTLATVSKAAESFKHWDLDSDQIAPLFCPMMHGSGLFTMLAYIQFGVPFVLFERFNADAILDAIECHRCTWVFGLPFMFAALLRFPVIPSVRSTVSCYQRMISENEPLSTS